MQSSRWGVVAGIFTLLLLVVLAGVIWLTLRSQPSTVQLVTPPATRWAQVAASATTETPPPARTVEVSPDDETDHEADDELAAGSVLTPDQDANGHGFHARDSDPNRDRRYSGDPRDGRDSGSYPGRHGDAGRDNASTHADAYAGATERPGLPPGDWSLFTDANAIDDLVVVSNTVWLATDGGALAWSLGSRTPVKFTTTDGLGSNQLTAVADCRLPGLGVVFGSANGLHVTDPQAATWRNLTRAAGEVRYDDVSTLLCDRENERLVVGFAGHGIGLFDPGSGAWRYLDRSSGLGANEVRGLAVAGRAGPIWVVAPAGVTVVAGADSAFYEAGKSPLDAGRLGAIAADASGAIWLGGEGILYQVVGETWTRHEAGSAASGEFPAGLIVGIAPAADGTLWLATEDGTVCRFDPNEARCQEFYRGEPGMAAGPVTGLALDRAGNPYYATAGNGFSRLSGKQWRTFLKADEAVRGNRVGALAIDTAGALWVATEAGLQRFDGADLTPRGQLFPDQETGLEAASVRTLSPDPDGGLWAGGRGAAYFDGERWTPLSAANGLPGENVQAIAVDDQGRTWFGTDQGLSVWNGSAFFDVAERLDLPSDDFRALLADGDAVWIGTAGGLYRFADNQMQVMTRGNVGLPSDVINTLALAPDGTLLIGTDGGFAELRDGEVRQVPDFADTAIAHVATAGDEVWVAPESGPVSHSVGAAWEEVSGGNLLPLSAVTALASDGDRVWFGSSHGLAQLAR